MNQRLWTFLINLLTISGAAALAYAAIESERKRYVVRSAQPATHLI